MASSSNTSSPQRSTGCTPIWPSLNLPSAMSSSTWRLSGGRYKSKFPGYTAANKSYLSCVRENLSVSSGMIWEFDTSRQDLWRNFKMTELLCSTFTYRSVVYTFLHLQYLQSYISFQFYAYICPCSQPLCGKVVDLNSSVRALSSACVFCVRVGFLQFLQTNFQSLRRCNYRSPQHVI